MMQSMAKDFLAAEYPDKVLKAMVKDEKGYTPELWKKMAETGLMALSLPEQYGGMGDILDLIVVLEEMGRVCFLTPYFSTVVLAAGAVMSAGTPEQQAQYLANIAGGSKIMTLAFTEASGAYTPESIKTAATPQGSGYIINGTKCFVPDAPNADYLICAARTGALKTDITLFVIEKDAPGLSITPLEIVSGEKQAEVKFENVKVNAGAVLGEVNAAWPAIEKTLQRANVARCAEMVGIMDQALKLTLDYVKERIAFGHPIGAFQSLQHRCADMLIDIDGARNTTYQAGWKLNAGPDAAKEVAIAKAWTSRAAQRVMFSAHQAHGAIAFTEDHILHYYTRRARAYEFSFGGADDQLEKLAGLYK